MENKLAFFGEQGLTSTSANYVANLLKEKCTEWEAYVNSLTFYTKRVSLIGSSESSVVQHGLSSLSELTDYLDKISKAKSLIAWLREAIKTKDVLIVDTQQEKEDKRKELIPKFPEYGHILTEEEYYDSLSTKERNRYYSLETEAAVIGKVIHKDGSFNKARRVLSYIINNPNKVEGEGRDTIIYSYSPTISEEEVNEVFFDLQKKHRSIQAELNSIKNKCQEAINKSITEVYNKYNEDVAEYKVIASKITNDLNKEYDEKINKINKLKIVIPNDLKDIYEQFGK